MAMANSYFRRGHYSKSAFLTEFLTAFWNFENPINDKFVSMDFDRVRINVDTSMVMEFDTWFGAKFNKNINDIVDGTVKLTPPLDLSSFDINFCFGNVYSLNILWYSKGDIKVFQSEEFKQPDSKIEKNGKEYFPAKYVHSEFDTKNGTFRHFDGAIHFYTEDEYLQRRDSDFNHNEKSDFQIKSLSQKLFKLNGEIETQDWSKLTSLFMNNNPLVFEYFEGKLPEKVLDMVKSIRANR